MWPHNLLRRDRVTPGADRPGATRPKETTLVLGLGRDQQYLADVQRVRVLQRVDLYDLADRDTVRVGNALERIPLLDNVQRRGGNGRSRRDRLGRGCRNRCGRVLTDLLCAP